MTIGPVELLSLGALLVLAAGLLYGLVRATRQTPLDEWARVHGIRLTEATQPVADRYLRRGFRWRAAGALLGALVPWGSQVPGLEMITGYLLGAILSEVTSRPLVPAAGAPRASLVPRSVQDYVPGSAVALFRAMCALALVAALSWYVLPLRADLVGFDGGRGAWGPVVVAASAAVLFLLVELTVRHIVGRSQPAGEPDLVALDDAVRSASLHATVGAGIGVAFLLLASMLFGLGVTSDVQLIRWVGPGAAVACGIGGVWIWLRMGHDTPWRVRRPVSTEASS